METAHSSVTVGVMSIETSSVSTVIMEEKQSNKAKEK